jgi:predicted PurR-regulated permease PerM
VLRIKCRGSWIIFIWLWGVPGALLSAPILVSLKTVFEHFPAFTTAAELLDK